MNLIEKILDQHIKVLNYVYKNNILNRSDSQIWIHKFIIRNEPHHV